MVFTGLSKSEIGFYEMGCPYNGIDPCMASITSLPIDEQKQANCCSTENYDDCPIYLSKLLRTR